jgi:hypothetical protein
VGAVDDLKGDVVAHEAAQEGAADLSELKAGQLVRLAAEAAPDVALARLGQANCLALDASCSGFFACCAAVLASCCVLGPVLPYLVGHLRALLHYVLQQSLCVRLRR